MSSIDDRIVAMKFDNSRFERGVATTMSTLDRLKRALSFGKTKDPLADIQQSANGLNLNPAMSAVQGLSTKFLALSTIAITALSNIVNKAVDAGLALGKSLTLQPIMDGFAEYELKMGSIQTILSNTSRHGTTLKEVTGNLDELNEYADKTIYNFGDMTKNIGLFTNAGIKIEDATSMIKGFSNEAAASGTNSQGAASAAYQLSQALSAGTIRLMDWRSLQNVGMGNKNMQNGLIEIADAMGELDKASISSKEVQEDFNGSLEKKWLSADVMQNYLKIQAGELSKAQMKNLGLSDKQIVAFQKQQKISEEAATKVRTWTQLIGTLQEGVGSSWAETFDIILGDFNEATELFTAVSETLGGMLGDSGKRRNDILKEWDKLGGRTAAIEAVSNAFKGLMGLLAPIKEAFREIFPAKTGKDLYNITVAIRDFTRNFKMGAETTENVKRTFRGFFAVLSIGWQIVKGVAGVIGDLFGVLMGGSGGFLEFTGGIGDFFTNIDKNMKKGKGLTAFFDGLSGVLQAPLKGLMSLAGVVGDFFDELELGKKLQEGFSSFLTWMGDAFGNIGQAIADAMSSNSFEPVMDIFKTGLLAGILILIKKFFKDGLINFDFGGGVVDSIKDTFDGLTGSLTTLQTNLKAKTLLAIAGAIALLTASVVALSLIDSKDLTKALTAMSVGFGELLGAMAILTLMTGTTGFIKIPFIAGSLILLSAAILVLSFAVAKLGDMDWEELKKGLTATGLMLGAMVASAVILSKNSGKMISAGVGMVAMAIGINIMASAVKKLGNMDSEKIKKGLISIGIALAGVIAAMYLMPKDMFAQSVAMLLFSVALTAIAKAVTTFGELKTDEISQGLIGLGGSLAIIVAAMWGMPPNMLLTAASLVLLSAALGGIANAVTSFGEMTWSELAIGLTAMALSLTILGVAMLAMNGSIVGAIAVGLAAASLALLVPPLIALGNMSWQELLTGLIGLAAALTILGIAAYLINFAALAIVGLGAGMLLLGAGLALAGIGAVSFATAFSIVVGLGVAGINMLTGMARALIELFPEMAVGLAKGIVSFTVELAKNAPAMITALNAILIALLDAVIQTIPKIQETMNRLIQAMLNVVENNIDDMTRVGFKIFMAFLNAIKNNIYQITTVGADIIIRFLNALTGKMPQLVTAGVNVIVSFINGISNNIGKIVTAATDLVVMFIFAIATNIPRVADAGAKLVIATINGVATAINNNQQALNKAANNLALAIINGMVWGLKWNAGKVGSAAVSVARDALNGARNWLGVNSPSKVFRDQVGKPISEGMAVGIEALGDDVTRAGIGVAESALDGAKGILARMGDAVSTEIQDPVVRPVLDLSDIRKNAGLIDGMVTAPSLASDYSYSSASQIAGQVRERPLVDGAAKPTIIEQKVEFNQHNNSPKELSAIDIYRQTNNQLSAAKGALTNL